MRLHNIFGNRVGLTVATTLAVLGSLLPFCAAPVLAEDAKAAAPAGQTNPKKAALLKELCTLLAPGKSAESTMLAAFAEQEKQTPEIIDAIISQRAPKDATPEKIAEVKKAMVETQLKVLRRTHELFSKQIDMNGLCMSIYTTVYDKYFTEPQLKQLIAFYKSSAGKRLVEVQPQIATEAIRMTNKEIEGKIMSISQQVAQEMAGKAAEKSQEAPTTAPSAPAAAPAPEQK
ncbi:MAG: DUF2059 domain-containing protein [Candidatus Obscuribacter sp.]|nr:DUF2059 domain-containing protein [Candidatus Obscuribacter sp.]